MKKHKGLPKMLNPPPPPLHPYAHYMASDARKEASRAENSLEELLARISERAKTGNYTYMPDFAMSEDLRLRLMERGFEIDYCWGPYETKEYYVSWK